MRNSSLLLLTALLAPAFSNAAVNVPFKKGDTLHYLLKFKIFNVAELNSEITELDTDKGTMELQGTVNTRGMGNTFYKSKYDMTASMNLETLSASKYIQHSTEEGGKEVKDVFTSCDPKAQTCTDTFNRIRKGEQKQNIKNITDSVPGRPQSILSLIYFLRAAALPATQGGSITEPFLFEEDVYNLTITNEGPLTKKQVDGEHTGVHYSILPIKVKSINGLPATVATTSSSDDNEHLTKATVYIANDDDKSVVYAASKLGKLGTVELFLR